jgi:SnoaL-like domain
VQLFNDESAVRRLLAKFANSIDLKAWEELGECVADAIYTDFSDLRGSPPESLTRLDFVATRRTALEPFKTHHLVSNVEVYINGSSATARVSAMIFRRQKVGQVFDSHCLYLIGLQSKDAQWQICSIVQRVFWSDGSHPIDPAASPTRSP